MSTRYGTETKPVETDGVTSELSLREQMHASLGRGITLLDRLHFMGLHGFTADDLTHLHDVSRQLNVHIWFDVDDDADDKLEIFD